MSGSSNSVALELEQMEDLRDAAEARLAIIDSLGEEAVPMAMVKRLSEGQNPVVVWREHRDLERDELADLAKIPVSDLAEIEVGGGDPGIRVMARIAAALRVELEDLLPWPQD
ncbi:MAG: helix-turn-helix transcriptional regulator [Acetobacteraceae bacterium]|nr:helix-turn-helix transcriptional regulator [Acetobacteraceae bacterium]